MRVHSKIPKDLPNSFKDVASYLKRDSGGQGNPIICNYGLDLQVPAITKVLECSTHMCPLSENFSSHVYHEEILTDACNVVFGLMVWKLSSLSSVTSGASWFWPSGTFYVTAELKRAKTWKWIQSPSYSKAPARSLTSFLSPLPCIVCLMCSQQPQNLFSQLKSSAKVEEEHNTVSSLWTLVEEESTPIAYIHKARRKYMQNTVYLWSQVPLTRYVRQGNSSLGLRVLFVRAPMNPR